MAAGLDDGLGVGEEAQRQEALAQVEPDPLDRIEFRAVGRQRHERQIVGGGQRPLVMPAGAVEHDDGVGIGRQRGGELGQKQVHRCGIDDRQHQREVFAGGGADGGEDIGPLVALLREAGGTLALQPPAVAYPPLVADARLVLKPELQALAGMCFGRRLQGGAQPLFWKRCCAFLSRPGWAGRAFWRENPMRRSTRVMLEG